MAIHGFDAEDRFDASSQGILDRFGIHLSYGHDFDEYRNLVAKARPDHQVGDPFNPELHRLGKDNAVWVVGWDYEGRIMHTQALRLLPTGNKPLATYFRRRFRDFSPTGLDIDFQRSRYWPGPGAKRILGRVVYSGETWVGGQPGQFRGTGLSSILGRHALLVAMRQLDADYVVGFMTKPVAYKGFCLRMGFMHAEPMALRWYVKGQPDALEGVMVYASEEDMRFVLDLPSIEMEPLAA
jgi:hypothetical protein